MDIFDSMHGLSDNSIKDSIDNASSDEWYWKIKWIYICDKNIIN